METAQGPKNFLQGFRVSYERFLPGPGQAFYPEFQLQGTFPAAGIQFEHELKGTSSFQVPCSSWASTLMLGEPTVDIGGYPRVKGVIPAPDHIQVPNRHRGAFVRLECESGTLNCMLN